MKTNETIMISYVDKNFLIGRNGKLTTSDATSDGNSVNMTTFSFQYTGIWGSPQYKDVVLPV